MWNNGKEINVTQYGGVNSVFVVPEDIIPNLMCTYKVETATGPANLQGIYFLTHYC
jgi:hypothetical protein